MSIPTLDELLTVRTADQWTAIALASLAGKNFPTTDWTSTSPERAMLETDTICLADQSLQIPEIVKLVLVRAAITDTVLTAPATPELQFLAYNFYELTVFPAVATVGNIVLTCNSTAGPYTIAVGQLIAVSANGLLYTNTTGGTLNTSSTLTLAFQAQQTGVAGNVGNDTILTLQTPLPGVSVDNFPPRYSDVTHTGSGTGTLTLAGSPLAGHSVTVRIDGTGDAGVATWSTSLDGGGWTSHGAAASITDLGGFGINIALTDSATSPSFVIGDTYTFTTPGTWITTQGADLESQQSLATRILARWPSLSDVPNDDVYANWARLALPGQVTRVDVAADPAIAATVNITIAGPTLTNTAAQVNAVQAYIDARCPVTDLPVVAAANVTPIEITGSATYPADRVGGHADLDAAIEWAAKSPSALHASVEVRPVMAPMRQEG